MKRILIALSLILSLTMVSAQPKSAADAQKALTKAQLAVDDAKKAAKPATWIALAKAYVDAYDQPTRNILIGTAQNEVKLFLKDQKVLETVTKEGAENAVYTVDVYADKELYYSPEGILELYRVTKPAAEGDLLQEAINALEKAAELDVKGSKAKDLAEMMNSIHDKLANEALFEYLAGDFEKASELFKQTARCYESPILGKTDSMNLYYTALVSSLADKKDQAIEYYNKCLDINYFQGGNSFSNLAELYRTNGDLEACKAILEKGFVQFPESNGILIGLINLYMENNEEPSKLFDLLHTAQGIDPNNASLYLAEGNVYKKLADMENAANLYKKASEINPNYVYAPLSLGILYYDRAIELQSQADNEFDDNKYMALIKQLDESLESAIEPLEKSFELTDDQELKVAIAEYLKNIYFRFREKSPEYDALSKKYDAFLKGE